MKFENSLTVEPIISVEVNNNLPYLIVNIKSTNQQIKDIYLLTVKELQEIVDVLQAAIKVADDKKMQEKRDEPLDI